MRRAENIMWIIELNIAGQRFTREIADLPHHFFRSVRFRPHTVRWRVPQLRKSHAA